MYVHCTCLLTHTLHKNRIVIDQHTAIIIVCSYYTFTLNSCFLHIHCTNCICSHGKEEGTVLTQLMCTYMQYTHIVRDGTIEIIIIELVDSVSRDGPDTPIYVHV